MAVLRKDNVTLKENDQSKIKELKAIGYEEIGKDGKVIADKKDKTVSAKEYDDLTLEHEELKKENTALKGQVTKLENAAKEKDKNKK